MSQDSKAALERIAQPKRGPEDEPVYTISIAARMVNMHAQTLRYYERVGLIKPSRTSGRIRLYSVRDIERLKLVQGYIKDLGVNLAGVEVLIRMTEHINQMERQMATMQAGYEEELRQLKARLGEPIEAEVTVLPTSETEVEEVPD